jgi:hypothetical protein
VSTTTTGESSPSALTTPTPTPIISERTEGARRILEAQGWTLVLGGDFPDGEPRIRDIDAAARLGYSEPRMVRKLIKRIWPENKAPNCRSTVERQPVGPGGKGIREYTVSEYWLTEAELLKLCARSETPIAESILDDMIAVYVAVRRYLATTVPVQAHSRGKPTPRQAAAPALPAVVAPPTFGVLPDWFDLRRYAAADAPAVPAWAWEALSRWPIPPYVEPTPALLRDLGRVALGHTLLASFRRAS